MLKKYNPIFIALFITLMIFSVSAETAYPTITRNTRNKTDGFDYEFWIQNRGEDASMTLTGGGTFTCEWNDAFNVLFRMGKKLGSTKTYEQYGDISVEYGAEHNILKGDVSYLCVYGWTQNPLIEFYVVENYGNYKPPGGKGFQGLFEVDGGFYEVYKDTRVQQPSIEGTKTFDQYFSVRREKRTEGTISLTEHFRAWEEMGLDMSGVMFEVALCVEGFRSSGNAEVYWHLLKIGGEVYGEGYGRLPPSFAAQAYTANVDDEHDINEETPADNNTEPAPPETPINTEPGKKNNFPLWLIFIILCIAAAASAVLWRDSKRRI